MMILGWFIILASMFNVIYSIEYFIGSMNGGYNDSINICYDDGGILAVITNEYEFNIARQICMNNGTNCWIGLSRLNIDNEWRYIDGTSVKGIYGFDNNGNPTIGNGPWGNNEPNNQDNDGSERCIHFNIDAQYMWNDKLCSSIYSPLCMRNQNKYFIGSMDGDYNDSINICYDDGGILGVITNEYEFSIARELCNNTGGNCWIGLNRLNIDNEWRYIDGTSVNGTYGFDNNGNPNNGNGPWGVGGNEPNNFDGNERCIQFDGTSQCMWNDNSCSNIYSPLCMRNQNKYFIGSTSSDNYTDAINYCSNNGAVLATIINENDYIDAQNVCNNRDCWIGLNRINNENVWQYMDGTSVNGTYGFDLNDNPTYGTGPWDINQPDNGDVNNEECVHFSMLDNNKWNDRSCWADYLIPLCMRKETQTRNIYSHVGCYGDTADRAMRHHDAFVSHTPQSCYVYCAGYMYFGIQNGRECYCDNDFNHSTKYGVSNNCQNGLGGQWSNSIYYIITQPTVSPTVSPTISPTLSPTLLPTISPTISPTVPPTLSPTVSPTLSPTINETNISTSPTIEPTLSPTNYPSIEATTLLPTMNPTLIPTFLPTINPNLIPTLLPTTYPTIEPTIKQTTGKRASIKFVTIFIIGVILVVCCVTVLMFVYILSKQMYLKHVKAMQKQNDLASLGYNTDIDDNKRDDNNSVSSENIVIKGPGMNQSNMSTPNNINEDIIPAFVNEYSNKGTKIVYKNGSQQPEGSNTSIHNDNISAFHNEYRDDKEIIMPETEIVYKDAPIKTKLVRKQQSQIEGST